MPNRLIDSQISMNSSVTDSISIPVTSTPTLFATLGLNATTAGPNLEVQFTVTSMVSLIVSPESTPVTITVHRVVDGVPTTIYSATTSLPFQPAIANTVITLNGSDSHPPAGFLIYQAFISTAAEIDILPTRIGPESMIAAAYSD
ncbi:hypothetical protein ACTHPF_12325 [Paenibacillus sp. SAF-054]|uniref:hypothetical protein n=1 Tax=unclassified Paenibacillus TaxID=185978 RepID=UPI003F815FC8